MLEERSPTILYQVSHGLPADGTSKETVPSLIVGAMVVMFSLVRFEVEGEFDTDFVKIM
jgi:hypothetical protein